MTHGERHPYESWADRPGIRLLCFAEGIPAASFLILFLALIIAQAPSTFAPLRNAQFDLYQQVLPRVPQSAPAVIVAIDEYSLQKYGQWPWPRNYMAHLLDNITKHDPAAVGLDMLFPEVDRLSPDRVLEQGVFAQHTFTEEAKALIAALPSTDAHFERSLSDAHAVLGVGGSVKPQPNATEGIFPPVNMAERTSLDRVAQYGSFIRSLSLFEEAAWGHGLLAGPPDPDGVVRRVPVISASTDGKAFPSLTMEMLRVALGANWYDLLPSSHGMTLSIGGFEIDMRQDGTRYVHYAPHNPDRFISAADVLDGNVLWEQLNRKLVLLGVTGLGIVDYPATPVAARMPGVEIHAQLLENIFDGDYLQRPGWLPWVEALSTVLLSLAVVAAFRLPPAGVFAVMLGAVALTQVLAWGGYAFGQLLIDGLLPASAVTLTGLFMLGIGYAETEHRRGVLRRDLDEAREQAARVEGELSAARRIQLGILPQAQDLPEDARFSLAAMLEPAKAVGGDLYDFFLLDQDRLFFAVGDVSGKGVPASLFMAISKALVKSSSLRPDSPIDEIVSRANEEIARDNPEMLFVTLFAGILHLDTGKLDFCNAGHDAIMLKRLGQPPRLMGEAGGPPLCVMEGFPYPSDSLQLDKGDLLFLSTDGIVEAQNERDELFGQERLTALFNDVDDKSPEDICDRLVQVNRDFVGHREPFDDLTVLLIRWHG